MRKISKDMAKIDHAVTHSARSVEGASQHQQNKHADVLSESIYQCKPDPKLSLTKLWWSQGILSIFYNQIQIQVEISEGEGAIKNACAQWIQS